MNIEKIKSWMEKSEQTAYTLSKKMGLSPTYFYNMLKGNYYPSVHIAYAFCKLTGSKIEPKDIYDEYSGRELDRKLVERWLREKPPWEQVEVEDED